MKLELKHLHSEGYNMLFGNVWHKPTTLKYSTTILLLEWHFDIFGLIEQGFAIAK